jgi:hypothetical protein
MKKDIDNLLDLRIPPPKCPDLASRIIARARHIPQKQPESLWIIFSQLFSGSSVPKPTFACTILFILGTVVGFSMPLDVEESYDDVTVVSAIQNAQHLIYSSEEDL